MEAALLTIDGKDGALHEVGRTLSLGPPKTKAGARVVHLPPFLVDLLAELRSLHPTARFVFTAAEGGWHRRANFRRRIWLPAVAGDTQRGWEPVAPGLHFHDLRHTHKTWLIEDNVPDVLQHPAPRTPATRCSRDLLPRHPHDDHYHARRSATTMGAKWEHRSR
jgi:integrase